MRVGPAPDGFGWRPQDRPAGGPPGWLVSASARDVRTVSGQKPHAPANYAGPPLVSARMDGGVVRIQVWMKPVRPSRVFAPCPPDLRSDGSLLASENVKPSGQLLPGQVKIAWAAAVAFSPTGAAACDIWLRSGRRTQRGFMTSRAALNPGVKPWRNPRPAATSSSAASRLGAVAFSPDGNRRRQDRADLSTGRHSQDMKPV